MFKWVWKKLGSLISGLVPDVEPDKALKEAEEAANKLWAEKYYPPVEEVFKPLVKAPLETKPAKEFVGYGEEETTEVVLSKIQEFFNTKFADGRKGSVKELDISDIAVANYGDLRTIEIWSKKPGFIVGKKGKNMSALISHLDKSGEFKTNISVKEYRGRT